MFIAKSLGWTDKRASFFSPSSCCYTSESVVAVVVVQAAGAGGDVVVVVIITSLDVTLSQLGRGRRTEPPKRRDDEQEDYTTTMTSPNGHYVLSFRIVQKDCPCGRSVQQASKEETANNSCPPSSLQ